jgi:hypothetical protein
MNDNELSIIVKLQDDASAQLAEMAANISESADTMTEAFAGTSTSAQESMDSLTEAMSADSSAISEEAIAIGVSFDEAAANVAASSAGMSESMSDAESNTSSSTSSMRSNFIQLGIVAGTVFAPMALAANDAVTSAAAWDKELAVVNQTLKDTQSSIPTSDVEAFAKAMQDNTLFTQTDVAQALELILSHKGLQDSYQSLTMVAADLATKMNTDLPSATRILTNALADPVAGINQIIRQGNVDLPASMVTMIDSMAKAGNTAGADKLLLEALNGSIGGVAGAANNAEGAGLQKLTNSLTTLSIDIGNDLLPMLDDLLKEFAPILKGIDDWVTEHPKLTDVIILGTLAISGLLVALSALGVLMLTIPSAAAAIATAFGVVATGLSGGILLVLGEIATAIELIITSFNNMQSTMNAAAGAGAQGQQAANSLQPLIDKATGTKKENLEQIQSSTRASAANATAVSQRYSGAAGVANAVGDWWSGVWGQNNNASVPAGGSGGQNLTFNFNGATVGDDGIKSVIKQAVSTINRTTTLKTVAGM